MTFEVGGQVTAEEAAAVVTVLAARLRQRAAAAELASRPERARPARSAWCDRASLVGGPVTPGPDGWRKSALPGF